MKLRAGRNTQCAGVSASGRNLGTTVCLRCNTAWADNIRHYNTSTTSIVESAHAQLKGWLKSSRNDLLRFFEKLQGFYDGHIDRYRNTLGRAQSQGVAPFVNTPFYSGTVRIINTRGLTLVEQQRRLAIHDAKERERNPQVLQPPCSRRWRHTTGLPCKHELAAFLLDESLVLSPSAFDAHWVIPGGQFAPDQPRLLDPQIRQKRRLKRVENHRHRRNEGIHGTARDPTRAERLDPNHPSTPPPNAPPLNATPGFIDPVRERRDAEPGRSTLPATRPQRVIKGCMCRKGCGTTSCSCRKQKVQCTKDCHRGMPRCSNRDEPAQSLGFSHPSHFHHPPPTQSFSHPSPFHPPPQTQPCLPFNHPPPPTQPFHHLPPPTQPFPFPPPPTQTFPHPPPTQPFLHPPPPSQPYYPASPAHHPHAIQPQPNYPSGEHRIEEEGQCWQRDDFVESYNPPRGWQRIGNSPCVGWSRTDVPAVSWGTGMIPGRGSHGVAATQYI